MATKAPVDNALSNGAERAMAGRMRAITAGLAFVGLFACNQGSVPAPKNAAAEGASSSSAAPSEASGRIPDDTVVGTWDGGKITYGELRAKAESELRKARSEYLKQTHQIEQTVLQNYILDQVVTTRAEAAGQDKQAFMKSLLPEVTVSDAEIQKFYEQNKDRIPQGLDAAKEQIRGYLTSQQQRGGIQEAMEKLKKEAQVKLDLPPPDLPKASFDLAGRPFKGPKDAKVTVVEFSDFQCPYCSRAVEPVNAILKAHPEDVKVVFLHFPLNSIHPQAKPAAIAAECAHQQGKFWEMHDKLFENQRGLNGPSYLTWAKELGLDETKFSSCLEDEAVADQVDAEMAQGERAGVGGTPSFFINGVQHSGGIPSPDDIASYLDS